jgi:hypothetical protein
VDLPAGLLRRRQDEPPAPDRGPAARRPGLDRRRGRAGGPGGAHGAGDLLLPWLSALDNALLGYRLRGTPRPELRRSARARAALLARVGLEGGRTTCRPPSRAGCGSGWRSPARSWRTAPSS